MNPLDIPRASISAHASHSSPFGRSLFACLIALLFATMRSASATALLILLGAWTTTQWLILLDIILYFGVVAVFVIGFSSSYVLDRNTRLGLTRGALWVVMAIVLVAVKKLAQEFA